MTRGFDHFYNLEYDEAIADFRSAVAEQPQNANRLNNVALAILYREMYRSGALESELVSGSNPFLRRARMNPSPEDQQAFDSALAKAMPLSQARLDKSPNDQGALYALGISYALRSNYNFLVRKAWLDALRDATRARKLHEKLVEIAPAMIDARLLLGVHDYIIGSLPWTYRVLGFVAGFHGDRQEGIRTLQMVAQKGDLNRVDAEIALCAFYRRERHAADAIPLLRSLIARFPRNFLLRFELAQMYADAGNKEEALGAVRRVEELRAAGTPGYQRVAPEKIYFTRGTIQFWYGDLDQALENMKKVTARADDLDLSTGVTAWLRLGQLYDLTGQRERARQAYRRAIDYAPQSDAARESRGYLSSPYRRPRRNS